MSTLDRRWIAAALALLCVQYLVALLIGASVGFAYQIPFRGYAVTGTTLAAIGLAVVAAWQLFCLWREGERHPLRRLPGRLPWAFPIGILLIVCQFAVLNWAKVMMPLTAGFWADPAFAALDHLLFGEDPWRISHRLLGDLTPLIDRIYAFWAPANFTFLFFLLFLPASIEKAHALIAYFLTLACGTLGQYLGASAGPIFYELLQLGDRFAALPVSPWAAAARDYLWSDYLRGGGSVGAGISAMPSMHVAVALWMALVGRTLLPRLQLLTWAYFVVILVGSVHLGWHYAVDGLASCAIVLVTWKLAKMMATVPLERARQPAPSGET